MYYHQESSPTILVTQVALTKVLDACHIFSNFHIRKFQRLGQSPPSSLICDSSYGFLFQNGCTFSNLFLHASTGEISFGSLGALKSRLQEERKGQGHFEHLAHPLCTTYDFALSLINPSGTKIYI